MSTPFAVTIGFPSLSFPFLPSPSLSLLPFPSLSFNSYFCCSFCSDTQAPRIFLTDSVPSKTKSTFASFAWTSSEPSKYECKLDGKPVNCGRGSHGKYSTPELPDGKHTFSLKTVDNVGNKGTPEVVNWEIGMYIDYRNTSGSLGEREIEVGTRACSASVSTQFRVLSNFHECFYNVWEHRKKMFSISFTK